MAKNSTTVDNSEQNLPNKLPNILLFIIGVAIVCKQFNKKSVRYVLFPPLILTIAYYNSVREKSSSDPISSVRKYPFKSLYLF